METLADRKDGLRFWFFGACAVVFSTASVYAYFLYMAQAAAVGAWIGLKKHEADVAIAQRWGIRFLLASVCCWGCSSIAGAFAMPIYKDASPLPRFIARLILGSMISLVLVVLIGWVSISIIVAFHRSIVR
jgi:hypothetical protein